MLTPRQLIDLCRDTSQPLPSGKVIAEVVERMEEERKALARWAVVDAYAPMSGSCSACGVWDTRKHKSDCPVDTAERILKEGA